MQVNAGYGKRVELVRRDTRLGKELFARLALSPNASAKNISRIEIQQVSPRLSTLNKIASFGGVDLNWLATGTCALRPNDIVRTADIGQRIAHLRRQSGLSRCALSRKAKLGNSTKNISRLETGEHRPLARTIVRIAEVLNVTPTYLAYGH